MIFAMTFPVAAAWIYFVVFTEADTLPAAYGASKIFQFSFPAIWVGLVLRRPLLRPAPPRRGIGAGLWSGIAILVLVGLAYLLMIRGGDLAAVAAPRIRNRLEAIGAATPVRYVALSLFLSLLHSFLEEYYWRWYVFGSLSRGIGRAPALLLSSLAFMAHHVIVVNAFFGAGSSLGIIALFSLAVACGGALWALLYDRSGSLYGPWISHVLADLAIMSIGYDLAWGLA